MAGRELMKMPQPLEALHQLLEQKREALVTLVAIDGHSAAGKSTLADQIHASYPLSTVVRMDDFYRPLAPPARAALDAAGGYAWYYDWQRLERQVLQPLRVGQAGRYQKYNWSLNRLDGLWHEVQPQGVVVVEGCYALRPELRSYFALLLLVESSAARRWQRQLQRGDAEDWLRRWDAAERYYMQTCRPEAYADLIVAGE